jgi:hypothetical protein
VVYPRLTDVHGVGIGAAYVVALGLMLYQYTAVCGRGSSALPSNQQLVSDACIDAGSLASAARLFAHLLCQHWQPHLERVNSRRQTPAPSFAIAVVAAHDILPKQRNALPLWRNV